MTTGTTTVSTSTRVQGLITGQRFSMPNLSCINNTWVLNYLETGRGPDPGWLSLCYNSILPLSVAWTKEWNQGSKDCDNRHYALVQSQLSFIGLQKRCLVLFESCLNCPSISYCSLMRLRPLQFSATMYNGEFLTLLLILLIPGHTASQSGSSISGTLSISCIAVSLN